MSGAFVRGDDEVIEGDVVEFRVTSGGGGEMAEMLQISDERILMIIVHVRDDSLFRIAVRCC